MGGAERTDALMHDLDASALPTVLESSCSCEVATAEPAAFYFCARGPPGRGVGEGGQVSMGWLTARKAWF